MREDLELLERYTDAQDEDAFRDLVERYLNVVYSAALRHTDRDVHLARDITQSVFTDLAQKASSLRPNLQRGQPLVGWLYTSTHFAASRLRRTEWRRRARETAALAMNRTLEPDHAPPEALWDEVRPLLETAMSKLPPTDRDAVLLRYFVGRDLPSISAALGLSDQATRKRIERALERLHAWLSARGIKTTAAALSAALATQAVQNAPGSVLAGVVDAALAGATTQAAGAATGFGFKSLLTTQSALIVSTIAGTLLLGAAFRAGRTEPPTAMEGAGVHGSESSSPPSLPPASPVAATMKLDRPSLISHLAAEPTASDPSDNSDTVTVPKDLLGRVPVRPLTMTEQSYPEYVLEPKFVELLAITPNEAERILSSVAAAMHHYRLEETHHLQPTDEEILDPFIEMETKSGIVLIEKASFRFTPFRERARAIQQTYWNEIHQTLGEDRAKIFSQGREMGFGIFNTFEASMSVPKTFTFRLTDRPYGARIDCHVLDDSGGFGVDIPPSLDQYAPESLKPAIARWRKWIADHATNRPAMESRTFGQNSSMDPSALAEPSKPPGEGALTDSAAWDERATHVNVSSSAITSLQIAGLTGDGEASKEAITICSLKPLETTAIRGLYASMKDRYLKLEAEHFGRRGTEKNKFVLRAFPDDSAALHQEWREKLVEMLGPKRGNLFDQLSRTRRRPSPGEDYFRGLNGLVEVDWLHPDPGDLEFELIPELNHEGQPGHTVRFRSTDVSGMGGGMGNIQPHQIPLRWQHVLKPDLFREP